MQKPEVYENILGGTSFKYEKNISKDFQVKKKMILKRIKKTR